MSEKYKDLSELEKKIRSNPNDVNYEELIQFLKDHSSELEKFGEFLFRFTSYDYEFVGACRLILKEIFRVLPSALDSILIPFFQTPDEVFCNNRYQFESTISDIKVNFIKISNYSYEQIANVLQKVIRPPYTLIAKKFVKDDENIYKYYAKINSEIYKSIEDTYLRLERIIDRYRKNIYIPKVHHYDTSNPRISKFGGVAPYLPSEGPKVCSCEDDKLQTVFSLYVPSLPDELRNLFPSNHEYVLVGYTCNTCYEELIVHLYSDEQIDQLVYDDVPNEDMIFNEPRTVYEWVKSSMYPHSLVDSKFTLPDEDKYSDEELYIIEDILSDKSEQCPKTYLGGYPVFVQGDDSPPDHVLLLEMEESEASTNMWGDCGTCQVWMTTDNEFGSFEMRYACC